MKRVLSIAMVLLLFGFTVTAQSFVHPGGLHTQADLDRMKVKVAAGEHPWIDGWNALIQDPLAQSTYTGSPSANMNLRQVMSKDAHAAYLNAIRWYVSGDDSYADCAIRLFNAYSSTLNQIPSGGTTDIVGLGGIGIAELAEAAEIMRISDRWNSSDFDRFKAMMVNYLYPVCHDFLTRHNGACVTHYWANWDLCNVGGLFAIGVLCDDTTIYNEGIDYFKNGAGNGNIMKAIYYVHSDGLGQWQESGRDQEHAQLGVGLLGSICQIAWNQGLDLFGYDNNRLLAGAEYVARTNLSQPVPYTTYNNCDNVNQKWLSLNGIGRIDDRPIWELIYNHYSVLQGLPAPNVRAIAGITRPERGSADHFGYGTLTFTLDGAASPYPASPAPAIPTGLTATASVSRVTLNWAPPSENNVRGYTIQRATTAGGPYTTVASWNANTHPEYTDFNVTNGTTYYYVVAANNQAGTSDNSAEVSATPMEASAVLPAGWSRNDIGTVSVSGSVQYASVGNNTFITSGAGTDIGGTADAFGFTYGIATGDVTITARLLAMQGVRKTGIMIRESLDPDAKAFVVKLGDAGGREAGYGMRTTTGGSMRYVAGNAYTWLPSWFRLQRSGDTFTAFESSDGVNWFDVGSTTASMNSVCYVGLVNCSGNASALNTTTFDNVTVVTNTTALNAPTGLTATAGNTVDTLTWNEVANASGYTVKRATTSGGPYVTVSSLDDTSYIDTALNNGTTYYYVVTAANLGSESENSSETSVTPQLTTPPVPNGAAAKAISTQQISLSWSASLSAEHYNVKRATKSGGPYTTIGSPTATSFKDETFADTVRYYYVVSAVNVKGESANSIEVSAAPGKVSYWKFNETSGTTAADAWGNRNGILASGANWIQGISGNAVHVDGASNSYVTLPSGLMSDINDFTVATWVKVDASATWARIFDFGSGTSSYMFLAPLTNTGLVRYAITTGNGEQQINSSSALSTGVWHHVAVTLSGNVGILYVDGAEAGRNINMTLKPSSLGNTTQNWIGKSQWNDPLLTGSVDEFHVYSRALTATEISNLVYESVPPPSPTNLTADGGNNKISLDWTALTGAAGYNVKRATDVAGPYTVIANVITSGYVDTTADNCRTYFYHVSAFNDVGESANSNVASLSFGNKLTGTLIGTSGSWGNNSATTKAAAVDGNLATFFDGPTGASWVGYDLGESSSVITKVRYTPRSGYASRMVGGMFQGSNVADFSTATTLFTVTTAPATGVYTEQTITSTMPFRYVRYISSGTGYGNVAEVEFYGLPALPPQIVNKADTQNIVYGEPFSYSIIASNDPNSYSATGLPDGLNLNSCTGIISGAPMETGSFSVILTTGNDWGLVNDTLPLNIYLPLTANIPDVYANSAGVEKNTLYAGYGPSSFTLTAAAAGGKAPYTYEWSNGKTTGGIVVDEAGSYSVVVTDAIGWQATASIEIKVEDVRCGIDGDGRVMVCHKNKSICIDSADVQARLNAGDQLGDCSEPTASGMVNVMTQELSLTNRVVVYPNPVSESITVSTGKLQPGATVCLFNINGQMVLTERMIGNSKIIAVKQLPAGVYYLQVRNGDEVTSQKLIKQ